MTSAQRTNARQDKIWEKAMALRKQQGFSNAEVHEALKLKDDDIRKLTQQRDELLAAVIGLVQANHEGMLTSAEWDAAATAIRHARAEGRAE